MPIRLESNDAFEHHTERGNLDLNLSLDLEAQNDNDNPSLLTQLINGFRIYNVPFINFVIISILGGFLAKLTTKYTGLYMKNSLITIIVTNLVLYGISETLAQSLLSYKSNQPRFSFRLSDNHNNLFYSRAIDNDNLGSDNHNTNTFTSYNDNDNENENGDDNETPTDDQLNQFIDYLQRDNESITTSGLSGYDVPSTRPYVPLTYFKFNRLAGFMCWGFIMGFAQCLWYKFLQIYSKDPKFIEVLRKVLTDQLCYSPISLFSFFTYGTIVLENGTWEDTKSKLSKVYLKTLIINYSVWFPVQFFNFLIVPRNYQVPFSSSISVLWNCFLSMRNSST